MIHCHVQMVVARRHCTGRHGGHGCIGITQDECQMAIDRREHEAGRHQPAQEHEPEDEQRCPAWFLNVAHPFHRLADSRAIRQALRSVGAILPFSSSARPLLFMQWVRRG
jgi:hypothetical protein